jgi:hypothetical protein
MGAFQTYVTVQYTPSVDDAFEANKRGVLGRTNRPLSFHTARTALKTMRPPIRLLLCAFVARAPV